MYSQCYSVFQLTAVVTKLRMQKLLGHVMGSWKNEQLSIMTPELILFISKQKQRRTNTLFLIAKFSSIFYKKRLYFFSTT
jgi:hypothetical protein